ncbi:hypothetical protein VHARVF571_510234 [Vibrio harveyi]|nr:hypothetical protein VHARVF571_510234 [Vibrio harveyi]
MLIVVIFQREVENYSFRGVICNEIWYFYYKTLEVTIDVR